jgi:hypothetical protein
METVKTSAMIHSLNAMGEVTIISEKNNNEVVVEYNGQRCTAVHNCFNGLYYVDDVYGRI